MAHQMKDLYDFSVFHCVEGAFGAPSGGNPKTKNGAPRDELKNGCGRGWAVPYFSRTNFCNLSATFPISGFGIFHVGGVFLAL